ncbi:MAG: relaxase domain-containing protein [Victivallaceae bacterium]|nr:relaxase domain-containing protein [Victivallaceae bacterium]
MYIYKNSIASPGAIQDHFNHVSHNDFVDPHNPHEIKGVWEGRLAESLGMTGVEVDANQLISLARRRHPATGEVLRKCSGMRLATLCITTPKSVGIMALFDKRLVPAHEDVCRRLLAAILPGNIMYAMFTHHYNRYCMVHLHSHCIIPKLAYDNGKFLDIKPAVSAAVISMHDCMLAEKMRELGYHLTEERNGLSGTAFELLGVPYDAIEMASERRKELLEQAKAVEQSGDSRKSRKAVAILDRDTTGGMIVDSAVT